jgi:zinc protease
MMSIATLRARGRRAGLLAALFWLAASGPGGALAGVFDPETFVLENGMPVVVIPNHRAPVVSHMVWYKAGAADEPRGKSGVAHFLEHLMFKGTEAVPNGQFSKIVARNGGRENAFTAWDYTGYFQNVAKDRLELVMKLEADRMVNLRLDNDDVLTERDVILEERRTRIDNGPAAQLREQTNAALFMNHPYGRPVIGWRHEIEALSREDALDWYRTYYAPNNAILVIAGDVTAAEIRPLAEKYYGAIPARQVPERVRPGEPVHHAPRQVTLESPQVQQPSWTRTYLAPSYRSGASEHVYALQVLAEILGGGATSRLYRGLVVDQGIAAAARAYYDPAAIDLSDFGFYLSPRPGGDAEDDLRTLEEALQALLADLLANGVTAQEVERAKQRLQAEAVYARDSLQAGARVLGASLASGRAVAEVEAWPELIGEVTVAQVNAAARAVFVPARSVTGLLLPKPTG